MSTTHRIIKYFAIALAASIIVSIVTAIMFGVETFSYMLGLNKEESTIENLTELELNDENFNVLEIDLKTTSLIIKEGTSLRAETNNENITVKQDYNKLRIEEKDTKWFKVNKNKELVVYVPQDMIFNIIDISTGASKNDIAILQANKLELDFGAGKTTISNLIVTESANINTGAGKITIEDGRINNLDMDLGVGEFTLNSVLTGNSKIDSGIGKTEINLLNSINNYAISVEKGIGSIKINDNNCKDETTYGTGINKIEISGGIGSTEITTVE